VKLVVIFLMILSGTIAAVIFGCEPKLQNRYCDPGQTTWNCTVLPTACHMAYITYPCASNLQEAIDNANSNAIYTLKLQDQNVVGTTCIDTGSTRIHGEFDKPKYTTQTTPPPPSCDAAPEDDACVVCAKTYCCAAYQACFEDTNCTCLVNCLYGGGTPESCAAADSCGAPDGVSISTAMCLNGTCTKACMTMGSMCGSSSSSSSSSGGGGGPPPCIPGPRGPTEMCFSDSDCASCVCDIQAQICN